jgi:hypothetical protein
MHLVCALAPVSCYPVVVAHLRPDCFLGVSYDIHYMARGRVEIGWGIWAAFAARVPMFGVHVR